MLLCMHTFEGYEAQVAYTHTSQKQLQYPSKDKFFRKLKCCLFRCVCLNFVFWISTFNDKISLRVGGPQKLGNFAIL